MTRRLVVALVGSCLAILAAAGGAFAYWTAQGAGSGTTTVGTMDRVTVAEYAGETIPNKLYPGGPAGDVIIKVTNPNLFTTTLSSVALNGTITGVSGIGTCSTTGVTFTPPASPNSPIAAATNPGGVLTPTTTTITLRGAVSMDATSDAGCQGATFHIPVTISVHR